ncbi:MAG: endonuclease III domain-containing protein [Chloroflexi bacterium]|nr:endonuclease III domain-containing protein [Chloroflexota bacterium]
MSKELKAGHRPDNCAGQLLLEIYDRLYAAYGPQHWWPAEEPFEVMVGAILTQSTAWRNVEKAIINLKEAGVLSPTALRRLSLPEISALIRPSGYHNSKARKLKALAEWMGENYDDNSANLSTRGTSDLRHKLLSVCGIGPETADSILLYAAGQPVFVIDAYTRRIMSRIGLVPDLNSFGSAQDRNYNAYRQLFMGNLPADTRLFNEYHALLVRLGKDTCRKQPRCAGCCLADTCRFGAGWKDCTISSFPGMARPDKRGC